MLTNKYILLTARFSLGIVFVLASIDKIAAPDAFAAAIHSYRLLPDFSVNILALIIPWIELVCGVFLAAGFRVRGSALVSTFLLAIFTVAIISALLRGLAIDCGCFGRDHSSLVSWWKVIEDVGLAVVGLYLFASGEPEQREAVPSVLR